MCHHLVYFHMKAKIKLKYYAKSDCCLPHLSTVKLYLKMSTTICLIISCVAGLCFLSQLMCLSHTEPQAPNSTLTTIEPIPSNMSSTQQLSQLELNIIHLKEAIKTMRRKQLQIISTQLGKQINPPNTDQRLQKDSSNVFSKSNEISVHNKSHKSRTNQSSKDKSPKKLSYYVENGIFWSQSIESQVPKGFSFKEDLEWIKSVNTQRVLKADCGCGRMQNRMLTFENGSKACARYRKNNDQIQGEFFSFLLARLLGIQNVPPSTFAVYRTKSLQWEKVKPVLEEAQWEAKPIVLTQFIADLTPSYIPKTLRTSRRRLYPLWQDIGHLNNSQIIELVQWSDLIVFDYLTANIDRMINNMINERWNPQMMDSPAHNLLRHEQSNLLIFLDNESGLFHGYRLLKKYETLHRSLLDSLCIFRQLTVSNLKKLVDLDENAFHDLLSRQFSKHSYNNNATTSMSFRIFPQHNMNILRQRMRQVLMQVNKCQRQFHSENYRI